MFCKKCGYQLKDGALFCKKCGNSVVNPSEAGFVALFCGECGYKLKEGALFCKKCGNKVVEELPAAEEIKVEAAPSPVAEEIKSAPVAEEIKPKPVAAEPKSEPIYVEPGKPEPVAVEPPKPVAEEIKPAPVAAETPKPEFEKPKEPVRINTSVCQHCGSSLKEGLRFCEKCGYKIERLCPNCGESLGKNLLFCGKCGAKVEKDSVAVQSAPQSAFRWHDEEEQKYGTSVPAVPQKQTKWQKAPTWRKVGTIVSCSLFMGLLVYILCGIVLRRSDEPYAPSGSYPSSSKSSTSSYNDWSYDWDTSSDTDWNNGYTGGNTEPEPVKQQKFTSPKTGTEFTIPERGHAVLARGGTVNASYQAYEPSQGDPHGYFNVNNNEVKFCIISPSGGWKAGLKLGYSDLCVSHSDNYIFLDYPFAYLGYSFNGLFSNVYPEYFNDGAFEVIEASGNNVVFWFYAQYKVSGSGEYYTIEGVGNVVLGGSSGGSSGGNTGGSWDIGTDTSGGMTCGVCIGSGMVNCSGCVDGYNSCPNCNGSGTYYVWGESHSTWCTRCNGGGKIQCSRCYGSGKVTCMSCGGDGKI